MCEHHYAIEDVVGRVVDGSRTELLAESSLLGATGDRDHVGTGRRAELDHRGTDRACSADDEQGLAGVQACPGVQREVACMERQRERGGFHVVKLGWWVEHAAQD